ncbi:hypothetical protein Gogos_019818 [Gossypium gossypioides]|uniref:Uncharacterized protein n=1 Tax=Gossypium gossypioides TaxID=34282 RepID=A0A7J9D2K7_GOSGO|nr:hypothetical protein [Gossypium gossypioides]
MTVVESVVKLGLGKDKLESSKSKESGACEKDHKEDFVDDNGNSDNSGNGKPRVGKKKPKRKRDKLKYFLCDGLHMLKTCPKKSALKEKLVGNDGADKEPKKLGSSKGKAEANRAKRSKKKRVKCFLCRGPHELRNCPKQAVVKRRATSEFGESSEGLPPKEDVSLSSDLEEKSYDENNEAGTNEA